MKRRSIRRLMVSGFVAIALSSAAADDVTAAAEQGDPEAQFRLGRAYQFGEEDGGRVPGIPKDHDQAMAWIRKAADQGYPQAQFWLGQFWRGEHGWFAKKVLPDRGKALAWYRKAAEQGHPHSQFLLGAAYYDGDMGVLRDYAEAVVWYRKAAGQGHQLAQQSLSICYLFGEGVARDVVQAYAWKNLMLRGGMEYGRQLAAESLDLMEERMTPAQIAEAQALSRELAERVPVLEGDLTFQQYGL